MSRSAKVSAPWAGARRDFRLGIAELDELDEICKVGPGYLLALVSAGVGGGWKARQLREVLRLGLIGGGMQPNMALALVERYFDDDRTPLSDSLVNVQLILMAAVVGNEDDPDSGERSGGTTPNLSPMDVSVSAPSTKSAAPSASPTSDVSASGSSADTSKAGGAPTARKRAGRARSAPRSALA